MRFGRPYLVPPAVQQSLEHVFAAPVGHVRVIEHSAWARCHPGMVATTRPGRILLAVGGDEFVAEPELVLHEYFHVLRQWQPARLTRRGYLIESARRGYRDNRYECEARAFAAAELARFRAHLARLR
jgi:hypothetical protein